ncbi:MAG: diaminopimelate decarboxylase [Clostridia bacterium]|nr:diaminopimelate decarboxylase [Clostridia bacterium]
MFLSDSFSVNAENHLTIGGVDTLKIAQEYGTPVYVLDEDKIRRNCRAYASSICRNYPEGGLVLYASKALCCKELCRICMDEGIGLDVVSGGELYTAHSVGFPMDKICFHGNNKTLRELTMAVEYGVGRVIVDNLPELEHLEYIAGQQNKTVDVLLRIKPGVEAHTHEFIRTGQIDSKFGFALETGEAQDAVQRAAAMRNVHLTGLHCHIGSQIFDDEPFIEAARVMLDFMAQMRTQYSISLSELNLGGGFAIRYRETDPTPLSEKYMDRAGAFIRGYAEKLGIPVPFIYIEPGRSIVGDAGLTLYTVGSVKTIPGVRTYVCMDGGMFDNPRYILYQAEYEAVCADRAGDARTSVVTIAGKCCESGDLIQEHTAIQPVQPGDTLAILCTGAYNYSMASNYNRNGKPPVVMVRDGKARLIVRGETLDDLIRCDL